MKKAILNIEKAITSGNMPTIHEDMIRNAMTLVSDENVENNTSNAASGLISLLLEVHRDDMSENYICDRFTVPECSFADIETLDFEGM